MIAPRPSAWSAAVSRLALLAGAAIVLPSEGRAQCVPSTTVLTVVGFECKGLDPDGIAVAAFGVVGRVEPGARVEGETAIAVGDRATVIVEGTVEAGEVGVSGGRDLTLLNEGRVAGGGRGVESEDLLVLRNGPGAVIAGDGEAGIVAGESARIDNEGVVQGGIEGVGFTTVRNAVTGRIAGGTSAIGSTSAFSLDNAGLVEGATRAPFGADVVNRPTGVIRGTIEGGAGGARVANDGLVEGFVSASQSLSVTNRGTILGGGQVSTTAGSIDNSGVIRSPTDALIGGLGGFVPASVGIMNTGIIIAGDDVVEGDEGASLTNSGTVVAGDDAVAAIAPEVLRLGLASLTNTGLVTAGDDAVVSTLDAEVENTGTIDAGSEGVEAARVATVVNGAGGVIRGGRTGVLIGRRAVEGLLPERSSIQNDGLIEGGTDAAVRAGGTVAVTLGAEGALVGPSGLALDLGAGDDTLAITAGGAIEGDVLLGPGDDGLTYTRSMVEEVADDFGLFDGGLGFDEAVFQGFGLGDLAAAPVAGGFRFDLADGSSALGATLLGFESVRLDDVTLRFPAAPAPVPLPAGLPLLAGALGGLAALRRRRRPAGGVDRRPPSC